MKGTNSGKEWGQSMQDSQDRGHWELELPKYNTTPRFTLTTNRDSTEVYPSEMLLV